MFLTGHHKLFLLFLLCSDLLTEDRSVPLRIHQNSGFSSAPGASQAIDFLRQYADYTSNFINDPGLNTKVVNTEEVHVYLEALKPQPLPSSRQRIRLEYCKWHGYMEGSLVFSRSNARIRNAIHS